MIPGKGASLVGLRELNARAVLDVIRARAPISRAQISREVSLTRPTVAGAIETLLGAGLVRETELADGLSFGATFFEPAPDAAYAVAFDIDRGQCRAMLADAAGTVVASGDAGGDSATPEDLMGRAAGMTAELCEQADVDRARLAAGVAGVPATVGPGDGVLRMSAYRLLEGLALGHALSTALGVPVVAHNDTHLAAFAERAEGVAAGISDFAYLSVGRSAGAGVVLGGEVLRGRNGASGEIDEPADGESFLPDSPAADAFTAFAKERQDEARRAGAAVPFSPNPTSVFAAGERGDELALAIMAEEAERIAGRAALLCRVLDVGLIVLGGGIGRNCQPLLDQIRAALARQLRFPPRVVLSTLSEPPVLVGARAIGARMALDLVTTAKLARA